MLYSLGVALPVRMDFAERKRGAYIIIYVLAQVQFIPFHDITLLEPGFHRNYQIVHTSVARDGDTALDSALRIHGYAVVVKSEADRKVCVQNLGIAEYSKELRSGLALKRACARSQLSKFYYKGLQR